MPSTTTDRLTNIATEHRIVAMVALDTIHPLAERITRLLSHGRRIAIARRHATYLNDPPEVHAGLVLDGQPRTWERIGGVGYRVPLTDGPAPTSFGFAAYPGENCDTETQAWQRYHDAEAHSTNPLRRRRNMTEVRIVGGVEGCGPGRDDQITIRRWNENGICDERVIVFDNSALDS